MYIFFPSDDWDGTWGNPGKLGLSLIAMLYDSVFMSQHFCLYGPLTPAGAQRRKYLETNEFYQKLEGLRTSLCPNKAKHLVYDM
jgi:hypothetical protein